MITDKKSTSKLMDLTSEGQDLEEQDVRVIPVALGNEPDLNELQKITPWLDDILEIDKDDNPYKVADTILKIGLKGKWKSYLNSSHVIKYDLFMIGRLAKCGREEDNKNDFGVKRCTHFLGLN